MLETISPTDGAFKDAYNRHAFLFEHQLDRQPLFDLDTLLGLARRLGPDSAYWSTRPAAVKDGWIDHRVTEQSLEAAVSGIATSDTLVVLKNIEGDPVFGPVVTAALRDYAAFAGPALQDDLVHGRATLLISSPRRITAYHIDAESNFLLQLRGEKTVYVFDGRDRGLLPDGELEAFYTGNLNGAQYRPEMQDRAWTIPFRPGLGVHVPVEWPHWVQNGADMSVSISINYDLKSVARRARTFRANHKMRRLGLTPASPGGSAWLDGGKAALMAGLDRLRPRA